MANYPSVQIYLSESELQALKEFAEKESLNASKAGKKILLSFLFPERDPDTRNRIEERFKILEERIDKLERESTNSKLASEDKAEEIKPKSTDKEIVIQSKSGEDLKFGFGDTEYITTRKPTRKSTKKASSDKSQESKTKTTTQRKKPQSKTNKKQVVENKTEEKRIEEKYYSKDSIAYPYLDILKRNYLVVNRCADPIYYWGGEGTKSGLQDITKAHLYDNQKSASNSKRKAWRREDKGYALETIYDAIMYLSEEEKEKALKAWNIISD